MQNPGAFPQRDHRLRICQKQLTYQQAVKTYGPKFDLKTERTAVGAGTSTSHFKLPLGLRKVTIDESVASVQRAVSRIPGIENKYCALVPTHNTKLNTEGDV